MLSPSLDHLAGLAILLLSAAQPAADDFRSGLSAYNRGDYVTAFRNWHVLAEDGDAPAQAGLGFLFTKVSALLRMISRRHHGSRKPLARAKPKLSFSSGHCISLARGCSKVM